MTDRFLNLVLALLATTGLATVVSLTALGLWDIVRWNAKRPERRTVLVEYPESSIELSRVVEYPVVGVGDHLTVKLPDGERLILRDDFSVLGGSSELWFPGHGWAKSDSLFELDGVAS